MVMLRSHNSHKSRWALTLLIVVLVLSGAAVSVSFTEKRAFASRWCTSEECKAAEAKEAAAQAEADSAKEVASGYQAEINALQAEINALQAAIDADIARAEDLKAEIEITQAKLDEEQSALASLLVDMHFDSNSSALMILAGSETISDLAEKQNRRETVQTQVAHAAAAVRERKQSLEDQKAQVDANIADAKAQREQVASKQSDLDAKRAAAAQSAEAYNAVADEQRRIKEEFEEQERQAYIQSVGGSGVIVDPGLDSYAIALRSATGLSCPGSNWRYSSAGYTAFGGGYVCECTSYAGYKAREYWGYTVGVWGDANNWGNAAASRGLRVDDTPAPRTIGYYTSGYWGHVVWIESVNANGTVNYSEYNGNVVAGFSYVTGAPAWKFRYIHFD